MMTVIIGINQHIKQACIVLIAILCTQFKMIYIGFKMINQKQLALELNEIYIEYYNDFLTVERFASYKGWSLWFTKQVINSGRKINHNQKLLNELYSK